MRPSGPSPATRVPGAVAVLFTVCLVVLPVVRDQIVRSEPVYPDSVYANSIRDWGSIPPFSDDVSSSCSPATSTRIMAHLRELAPPKEMLTLLTATKDIDISEAAVLAKLVLS
jgi:hypothetical protein